MSSEDDDLEDIFPPSRFLRIPNVPVFDEHEGSGRGGKPKKVTADDLERIAAACNRKFDERGAATALTLGHTKDGDDVKEEDQPLPIGWAVRFRTGELLDTGKKALFCDWYIRRRHADVIETYPHRSVEWYRDRDDLNPISLLRTAPERDLPIIKYGREDDQVYKYVFTPPKPTSPTDENAMADDKTKLMDAAVEGESSTNKGLESKIDALTSMMQQFMSVLMEAVQGGGDEGDDDLLGPDDGDDTDVDDGGEEKSKPEPKKDAEKSKDDAKDKKDDEGPEKFSADGGGYAGPGNTYIPNGEKTKMGRDTDDKVQFERRVKEEAKAIASRLISDYEKENADLRDHVNYSRAEKAVAQLEAEHRIDFGGDEDKTAETKFFAALLREDRSGESFKAHFDAVAKKYRRKPEPKPDGEGVANALKYARQGQPEFTGISTAEERDAFIEAKMQNPALTKDEFLKSRKK